MTWQGGKVIFNPIFIGPCFDAAPVTHRHQAMLDQGALGPALEVEVQAGAPVVFSDAVIGHSSYASAGQAAKAAAHAFMGVFQSHLLCADKSD